MKIIPELIERSEILMSLESAFHKVTSEKLK